MFSFGQCQVSCFNYHASFRAKRVGPSIMGLAGKLSRSVAGYRQSQVGQKPEWITNSMQVLQTKKPALCRLSVIVDFLYCIIARGLLEEIYSTTTRRFCSLPLGLSLLAMGWLSPKPSTFHCSESRLAFRKDSTDFARYRDKVSL